MRRFLAARRVFAFALGAEGVRRFVGAVEPRRVIYVPGKLVNIVVCCTPRAVQAGGASVRASSPAEFARYIASEMALWGKVVRDNRIAATE